MRRNSPQAVRQRLQTQRQKEKVQRFSQRFYFRKREENKKR